MSKQLHDAILNGLYDETYPGHELLSPRLLQNDQENNIWSSLRQELMTCTGFTWAVAFVTTDMLVPFKVVMADLAAKNIQGTLITGAYLNFNSPDVFYELRKIPNLTVKLATAKGFHAKGYLFEHPGYQTVIIGSANFTRAALLSNYEWSLKVSSKKEANLTSHLKKQLHLLDQNSEKLTTAWLKEYEANWVKPPKAKLGKTNKKIKPNKMQQAALKQLASLVVAGEKRGLVVSATGTGKTYLGAFAVQNFRPRRFLYVVHRAQIAKKSLASFYQVIGGSKDDYGLLTGKRHDWNKKYLFATVQTLSQPNVLAKLAKNEFDYLLLDEAHRAVAPSYQRVLEHFTPQFCLGLTATPRRMDEQDIYQLFDYNLAYEINLRSALTENMLAPFHYVGVQDYEADGQTITETTDLRYLITSQRVDYVLKELDYYGYCGPRPCGLVFCSRQKEAQALAECFSKKGHPAIALTNQNSEMDRAKAVEKLENGEIEYIVSVDLFNEGVDIPALNQIVMLRNTQSSIVFIQQLGRGLRKYPGKDYVTVIDFIGNYKNNYLIPLALNEDASRDADQARSEVTLPQTLGVSTINFSKIATTKILAALDRVKLDSLHQLRQDYLALKEKIGRKPLLFDFYRYGRVNPEVFSNNHNLLHYGDFLNKMGEKINLTKSETGFLGFVTKELLNGKRIHELLLLKLLIEKKQVDQMEFVEDLKKHHAYVNDAVLNSVESILSLDFFNIKQGKTTKKAHYGGQALFRKNGLLGYELAPSLQTSLQTNVKFKELFIDALKTGLALNKNYDNQKQFTLYQQYDRKDVCRLLNWPLDVSAPMYGYRVGDKETPIFITYQKDEAQKRNALYHNTLADGRSLRWYTRTPRHLASAEVQKLLNSSPMTLHLFVKRSDAVGKKFFYLGVATIDQNSVEEEFLGPKKKAAVGMNLILKQPLGSRLYATLFDFND